MTTKIIELKSRSSNTAFYARLVWQELFNLYHAKSGTLEHLDNMLCDYDALIRWIRNCRNCVLEFDLKPYWFWGVMSLQTGDTYATRSNEPIDETGLAYHEGPIGCQVYFDRDSQVFELTPFENGKLL